MYDTTKPYTKEIMELISRTWETPFISVVKDDENPYAVFIEKFPFNKKIDHTDGIGTKGIYHWKKKTYANAALDALAMNLNDLAMAGAIAYKLQNHIIVPEEKGIVEVMERLSDECIKRKIAITGGETSIQNNINGMDVSLTVSGFFDCDCFDYLEEGDVLVGFGSSGLHSNGFTKVREVFEDEFRDEFVTPTKIYYDEILELEKKFCFGDMHITGGAFTKLKQITDDCDIVIGNGHSLKPQRIFYELFERGVSDEEMYKTFNCGIGYVISASQEESEMILKEKSEFRRDIIGKVIPGTGKIIIESMFTDNEIVL